MDGIITALKHVIKYLNEVYEPNNDVYSSFLQKYQKQYEYRKLCKTFESA